MQFKPKSILFLRLSLQSSRPDNIFNHIQNGILITNRFSEIIYVNPAYCRLTGYSQEELIGNKPGIMHSGRHDKKFYEEMWQNIQDNNVWEGEIWNRRKSGEIYPVYLTISALNEVDGLNDHYIGVNTDITYLKKDIYKQLQLALYDPLTELPNRTLYRDRASQSIESGKLNTDLKHAIFFMDLDKFKQVNDHFGHLAGDHLLKLVGKRLSSVVRACDTVARVGGDEFTAIINDIKDENSVSDLAKRMVDAIEKPIEIDGHIIHISISIGISLYPHDATNLDELLNFADKAMYVAKKDKSKIEFYDASKQTSV